MPRKPNARKRPAGDRMDFRLSPEQKALIEKAAAYSGETLTGFALATLIDEARRVVREHESVTLTVRDRERFLELLDSPPEPGRGLRRAARRHREIISRSE